jgi:hypothetical protein
MDTRIRIGITVVWARFSYWESKKRGSNKNTKAQNQKVDSVQKQKIVSKIGNCKFCHNFWDNLSAIG